MVKNIKDLRRERGYRSAREFADALGIAASSMSRYDKDPETIPLKHAWAMADLLDCSIDEVVGRESIASDANMLQEFYDSLLPETRALMDEFIQFAAMKDKATRDHQRAEEEAKYDRICQAHERMFQQHLFENADFGQIVTFADPAEGRAAFESFLSEQAAVKRKRGIDLRIEGLDKEMRDDRIDADATERHWSEDEIKAVLAEARVRMDEEYRKKDDEAIARIMEAYDRLHARHPFAGATAVEYCIVRLDE